MFQCDCYRCACLERVPRGTYQKWGDIKMAQKPGCCVEVKDFTSGRMEQSCEKHGWLGALPCPWPECSPVADRRVANEEIGLEYSDWYAPDTEKVHIRRKLRYGQYPTPGRMIGYFWEEKE